jgi:hypothetical protein
MKIDKEIILVLFLFLLFSLLDIPKNHVKVKSASPPKIEVFENHSEISEVKKTLSGNSIDTDRVDLNVYLDSFDPETEWNYTEIGKDEQAVLIKNNIYYDKKKGYYVKRYKK